MAGFDTIYTGKGLAANLPQDNGKAMGRFSDFITKAEEIKYQAFKETQDWFIKSQDVDPVMLLTTANQVAQDRLMKTYNEESSAILAKSPTNLSTEDRAKIIAGKNFLISEQQKMQSDMVRALQDKESITKDIQGNLDHDEFTQRWGDYVSGKASYGTEPLSPSAIDPDTYYSKPINKGHGTEGTISITKKEGGNLVTNKATASATEEEARSMVEADILGNDRIALGYVKKFQALPEETKLQYLDISPKDGTINPQEAQDFNPIIQWAKDNYWQKRIIVKEAEVTKPVTAPTKKNLGILINIGGKEDVPVPVGQKRTVDVKYGGVNRPNMYNLGGTTPLTDVPTTGGQMLYDVNSEPITGTGNYAKAYLKDYDADRKTLIVQVTTSDPTSGTERLQLVEIPEKNITDYQNIHLMVNGKETTIGALEGTQSTSTTTPSTVTNVGNLFKK